MFNIVLINDVFFPVNTLSNFISGGAESVLLNQYLLLKSLGYNTKILTTEDSNGDDLIKMNYSSKVVLENSTLTDTELYRYKFSLKDRFRETLEQLDRSNLVIISHTKTGSMIKELEKYAKKYSEIKILQIIHNLPVYGMLSLNINEEFYKLNQLPNCRCISVSEVAASLNNWLINGCCSGFLINQYLPDNVLPEAVPKEDCITIVSRITSVKRVSVALDTARILGKKTYFFTTSFSGEVKKEDKQFIKQRIEINRCKEI